MEVGVAEGANTTAATLWPLLLLGLGGAGLLELVGAAGAAATTFICPVAIWPVAEGEAPV